MDRLANGLARTGQRVVNVAASAGTHALDAASGIGQLVKATSMLQAGQHVMATRVLRTVEASSDRQFEAQHKAGKQASLILSAIDGHFASVATLIVTIANELSAATRQIEAFRNIVDEQIADDDGEEDNDARTVEPAGNGRSPQRALPNLTPHLMMQALREAADKHRRCAISAQPTLQTGCRIAREAVGRVHEFADKAALDMRGLYVTYDLARHDVTVAQTDCHNAGVDLSNARRAGNSKAIDSCQAVVLQAESQLAACQRKEQVAHDELQRAAIAHHGQFRFEFEQVTMAAMSSVNVLFTELRGYYSSSVDAVTELAAITIQLKNQLGVAKRISVERRTMLVKREELAREINGGNALREADAGSPPPPPAAYGTAGLTGFTFFDAPAPPVRREQATLLYHGGDATPPNPPAAIAPQPVSAATQAAKFDLDELFA